MAAIQAFSTPKTLELHAFTSMKVTELKFALKYSLTFQNSQRLSLSSLLKDDLIRALIYQLNFFYDHDFQGEYEYVLGCISDYLRHVASCTHYKWRDNNLYTIPKNGPWMSHPNRPAANSRESMSSTSTSSTSHSYSRINGHNRSRTHASASSRHHGTVFQISASAFNDLKFVDSDQVSPIKRLSEPLVFKTTNKRTNSSKCEFKLPIDIVDMINDSAKEPANGEYRIYWYMCSYADACNFNTHTPKRPVHVSYPTNFSISLNSRLVQTTSVSGRTGVSPLDITDMIPKSSEVSNSIIVNYNLTSMYVGMVMLAKKQTIKSMIKEIRAKNTMSADSVRKTFFKTSGNDDEDEDLVSTGALISLKCPLGLVRITTPSRSKYCQHSQCFDCECFLQMKQRVPSMKCPVCSLDIKSWRELILDCYFEDILIKTSTNDTHVYIEADGSWKPREQMQIEDINSRETRKRMIDVSSQDAIDLSDFSSSEDHLAGGSKRRRTNVIDLTLDSDDEDNDVGIVGVVGVVGVVGGDSSVNLRGDSIGADYLTEDSDFMDLPLLTQEDIALIDSVEASSYSVSGNSVSQVNPTSAAPVLVAASTSASGEGNRRASATLPQLNIATSSLRAIASSPAVIPLPPPSPPPQQTTTTATPESVTVSGNIQQTSSTSGSSGTNLQQGSVTASVTPTQQRTSATVGPTPTSNGSNALSTPRNSSNGRSRQTPGSRPRVLDTTADRSQGTPTNGNNPLSSPTSARASNLSLQLSSTSLSYPNIIRQIMLPRSSSSSSLPPQQQPLTPGRQNGSTATLTLTQSANGTATPPIARTVNSTVSIAPNTVPRANGTSGLVVAQTPVIGMSPTYATLVINADIAANNTPTASSGTSSHTQNGTRPSA